MKNDQLDCGDYEGAAIDAIKELALLLLESDGKPDTYDEVYSFLNDASRMLYEWSELIARTSLVHADACTSNLIQAKVILERLANVWKSSVGKDKVVHLIPHNKEVLQTIVKAVENQATAASFLFPVSHIPH